MYVSKELGYNYQKKKCVIIITIMQLVVTQEHAVHNQNHKLCHGKSLRLVVRHCVHVLHYATTQELKI